MTAQPTPHDLGPFVGGRPFAAAEQRIFFGRDQEIKTVSDAWRRHRLTLLHGPAGVGKTSLLLAGVAPFLRDRCLHVLPLGGIEHRPAFPLAVLPDQNPHVLALMTSCLGESPTRAAGRSIAEVLRRRAGPDQPGPARQIFLAIDQVELIFERSPNGVAHRDQLCAQLAAALADCPGLRLLLAVREDRRAELQGFAARLAAQAQYLAGAGNTPDRIQIAEQALESLDPSAAAEAVRGPLRVTGRAVSTTTVDRLVDELRAFRTPTAPTRAASFVDPAILQLVCARLEIDLAEDILAERLTGEVDRILVEHCAQSLATVAAEHTLPRQELLHRFRAAFTKQDRTAEPEAKSLPGAILSALEDRHLLRAWPDEDEPQFTLRHPRLTAPIHQLSDQLGPARQPDPPARLRAAGLALSRGDVRLARDRAQSAIRGSAQDGDLRTRADGECFMGNISYAQGDQVAAAKHYDNAAGLYEMLQDNTSVGWMLTAIGRLELDQDAVGAVRKLAAAASRLPNDPAVQTALAQALWQAGDTAAALAVLDGVLSLDGAMPEALRSRGEIYSDLGEADSALSDLSRIDHNTRPSTRAAWALARAISHQADQLAEEQALEPAIADDIDSGPVLLRVARLRHLRGNSQAAEKLAERAMEAKQPPLPPQLAGEAHRLITHAKGSA